MSDGDDFVGPCTVCGETVAGSPYVSLALFGVFCAHADGLLFAPEESIEKCAAWGDVPHFRALHVTCVAVYFEGVLADIMHRRDLEARGGDL